MKKLQSVMNYSGNPEVTETLNHSEVSLSCCSWFRKTAWILCLKKLLKNGAQNPPGKNMLSIFFLTPNSLKSEARGDVSGPSGWLISRSLMEGESGVGRQVNRERDRERRRQYEKGSKQKLSRQPHLNTTIWANCETFWVQANAIPLRLSTYKTCDISQKRLRMLILPREQS